MASAVVGEEKLRLASELAQELVLFAYDFPHKKTQDFLFRLAAGGLVPRLVVAAPYERLKHSGVPRVIRSKPRHIDLVPPAEIANAFGADYVVVEHNSPECH